MRIYKSFFRFEKCRKACKYRLYRLMRTYKEIVKNYILIYRKLRHHRPRRKRDGEYRVGRKWERPLAAFLDCVAIGPEESIGYVPVLIDTTSNKTELFDHRRSGNASLPDCYFLESLRDRGTLGDFIPQTPSLGTRPQTPSSLRAYGSFLSEKSMSITPPLRP